MDDFLEFSQLVYVSFWIMLLTSKFFSRPGFLNASLTEELYLSNISS